MTELMLAARQTHELKLLFTANDSTNPVIQQTTHVSKPPKLLGLTRGVE
jgi:hypothetical protein